MSLKKSTNFENKNVFSKEDQVLLPDDQ